MFEEKEEKEEFIVDTLEKADWCVRKILDAQKKIDENKKILEKRIAELKEGFSFATDGYGKKVETLTAKLLPFVEKEVQGAKARSLKFFDGTVGFRSSQRVEILNEEECLKICKKLGYDVIVETLSKEKIKKLLKTETVPYAEIINCENFYVKAREKNESDNI